MTNFKDSHQYGTFTHVDMLNYGIRILPEENLLQIVTDSGKKYSVIKKSILLIILDSVGSHGTHVASICSGYYEDNLDLNGVAPGAQILSIKIGDSRINGMETSYAFVNAVMKINLKYYYIMSLSKDSVKILITK